MGGGTPPTPPKNKFPPQKKKKGGGGGGLVRNQIFFFFFFKLPTSWGKAASNELRKKGFGVLNFYEDIEIILYKGKIISCMASKPINFC